MRIFLRILSVAAIVIAALFLLVYLVAGVNLWRLNQPFTTALVTTLTTVDQVVQKADPMVEQVVALSGEFAQIGNEIGGDVMTFAPTEEPTGEEMPAAGSRVTVVPHDLGDDMTHHTQPATGLAKPDDVTALEAAYGAPSQAGFGSGVFYERLQATDDLDQAALAKYRFFVGDLWDRYGEAAWMGPWKRVYTRQAGGTFDIVAELRGMDDRQARLSASVVLDEIEDAENASAALAAAFDDPAVSDLAVYTLGDDGAMAGILIAGRRSETGETTFLVFLLD